MERPVSKALQETCTPVSVSPAESRAMTDKLIPESTAKVAGPTIFRDTGIFSGWDPTGSPSGRHAARRQSAAEKTGRREGRRDMAKR